LSDHLDTLERVIGDVVAPAAGDVDRQGTFPRAAIRALGEGGILGLVSSTDVGGRGQGLRAAAETVEHLAAACGSTAMVVLMHYAAVAAIETYGPKDVREAVAAGSHLSTLAFSEPGSRSQFWAPASTARRDGDSVVLDATKSWVTSAAEADSYVWSSLPLAGGGPMTLWIVPRDTFGLTPTGEFDGLGLRGNGSTPVTAAGVRLGPEAMLGDDGAGLDLAFTTVLPWFLVLSGAFALGLMEAVTAETGIHLGSSQLEHLGQTLVQQPLVRVDYARMRLATDGLRAIVADTITALETSRPDGQLRVLEIKATAAEAAVEVTDLALKLGGGAAFRRELGIERRFRDARAARVMAPTTDTLLDIVGRAISGLPLLGPVG
jgi:isovaleryl-CoA dehydrogenase